MSTVSSIAFYTGGRLPQLETNRASHKREAARALPRPARQKARRMSHKVDLKFSITRRYDRGERRWHHSRLLSRAKEQDGAELRAGHRYDLRSWRRDT